jgi:hypothetical protein
MPVWFMHTSGLLIPVHFSYHYFKFNLGVINSLGKMKHLKGLNFRFRTQSDSKSKAVIRLNMILKVLNVSVYSLQINSTVLYLLIGFFRSHLCGPMWALIFAGFIFKIWMSPLLDCTPNVLHGCLLFNLASKLMFIYTLIQNQSGFDREIKPERNKRKFEGSDSEELCSVYCCTAEHQLSDCAIWSEAVRSFEHMCDCFVGSRPWGDVTPIAGVLVGAKYERQQVAGMSGRLHQPFRGYSVTMSRSFCLSIDVSVLWAGPKRMTWILVAPNC